MAMGHYYECPFCGEDYKDMKCVNKKCPSIVQRKVRQKREQLELFEREETDE